MAGITITPFAAQSGNTYTVAIDTLGYDDWAINNGGTSGTSVAPGTRKSGGGSLIGNTTCTSGSLDPFTGPTTFSWTGGTPTGSGSSTANIYNYDGVAKVTVPADTTVREVYWYVGAYNINVVLTATLSDGSAGPATDSSMTSGLSGSLISYGWFKVTYSAASAGQTLTLSLVGGTSGDLEPQAVGLKVTGGGPPVLSAVSSTAGIGSVTLGKTIDKALTSLTTTGSVGTAKANITLALTGVSSTTSTGNVGTGAPVLAQVTSAGSVGTAKANIALALTGNSSAGSVSNVSAGTSVTPTAVSAAGTVGTIPQTNIDKPISGVASTCSVGTPVPSLAAALSAVSSSTSVASTGVNVSVALTGVSSTCSVGTVRAPGLQLGPVQASGSVGTLALGVATAISGVSSTSTPGTVQSTPQRALSSVSAAGSTGNVVFGNVVVKLTGVSSGSIAGNVLPPKAPDTRNGELFFAQQMALAPYYTGPLPTPNRRGAIFYASGTWTVPPGATNVFVSASAGGGTPYGRAGDQLFHGLLDVHPGDVLSVSMLPTGDVYVAKGSTLLLSLYAGQAYGKVTWQATLGQQSGLPGGFGSGVDAGTPFPPILVFYWN